MPRFLAAQTDTRLITLPWSTPLEDWPEENLVALPRGISRHVVRFVRVGQRGVRAQGGARAPRPARVPAAARPHPARHPVGRARRAW